MDGPLTGAACWRADGTPIGLAAGWRDQAFDLGLREMGDPQTAWEKLDGLPHADHAHHGRLASDDPPVASTPLALRNSRTVSADTSTACAVEVAFAGPADHLGFNSAIPANLPSPSIPAAPENPSAGAGESARSPLVPTGAIDALTLVAEAAPPWFCGSAMPGFDAGFRGTIGEGERLQSAGAIDAQQREVVVLVLGDAIGIAVAGNRDRRGIRR